MGVTTLEPCNLALLFSGELSFEGSFDSAMAWSIELISVAAGANVRETFCMFMFSAEFALMVASK